MPVADPGTGGLAVTNLPTGDEGYNSEEEKLRTEAGCSTPDLMAF